MQIVVFLLSPPSLFAVSWSHLASLWLSPWDSLLFSLSKPRMMQQHLPLRILFPEWFLWIDGSLSKVLITVWHILYLKFTKKDNSPFSSFLSAFLLPSSIACSVLTFAFYFEAIPVGSSVHVSRLSKYCRQAEAHCQNK